MSEQSFGLGVAAGSFFFGQDMAENLQQFRHAIGQSHQPQLVQLLAEERILAFVIIACGKTM